MSAIIKSGNTGGLAMVRPVIAQPTGALPGPPETDSDRYERRITALTDELRQRDEAVAALRREVEQALERGKAEGRQLGLREAQDREAERLQRLEKTLEQAQSSFQASLAATERLAVLIARECLAKLLGDPDARADLIYSLVRAQLERIDRASLLAVDVSAADFSDDTALETLIAQSGLGEICVKAKGDVPSGGCTMTLRLGKIDIGLDQQWGAISAFLHDMASPGETA